MSLKKILAVLLLFSFTAVLLVGCDSTELGYYDLQKEMANLKQYENSGQLTFILNLPETGNDQNISDILARELLSKGLILEYKGKYDTGKQQYTINFNYKIPLSDISKELTEITYKDNTFYIKTSGLVNLVKESGDTEAYDKLVNTLNGAEYLNLTISDYLKLLGMDNITPLTASMLHNSMNNQKQITDLYFKFFDGLFAKVYGNFSTGLITKENNKYILTLDITKLVDVFVDMAKYTLNNVDSLEAYLIEFVNSLSAEEASLLGLTPETIVSFPSQIKILSDEMRANKDEYLAELDQIKADTSLQQMINTFKMSSSVEKTNSTTYENSLSIEFNSPSPQEPFNMTISANDTTKTATSVNITVPTEKIMRLLDFLDKFKLEMDLSVDTGAYSLTGEGINTTGMVNVKIIDGHTYLPLRDIANIFDEEVGWDSTLNLAYVKRGTGQTYVFGEIFEGRLYVKAREFESLGYKIVWNGATREVIITKSVF